MMKLSVERVTSIKIPEGELVTKEYIDLLTGIIGVVAFCNSLLIIILLMIRG